MEVPIIPETIDTVVLDEISAYTDRLTEYVIMHGNSIPFTPRSERVMELVKDFQKWYDKNIDVQKIACVKKTLDTINNVPCVTEEKFVEETTIIRQSLRPRRKPRTTLDDDSESDSEYETCNQPDDYYQ